MPDLPRKLEGQVACVREFLGVATLSVLTRRDLAVSFRSSTAEMSEKGIARANAMVQIATDEAVEASAPPFDKKKFAEAIGFALTQTTNHDGFYPLVKKKFLEAGVVLVVLPNLPGSNTNGATKKVGKSVMLMVNDRRLYADSFWFTLLHEAGHIMNGDFGISFSGESGDIEKAADEFAENMLINPADYETFVRSSRGNFTLESIQAFARSIGRDPGIVLGRLENDGHIKHANRMQSLRYRYQVTTV